MTVSQLISLLAEVPQDYQVEIDADCGGDVRIEVLREYVQPPDWREALARRDGMPVEWKIKKGLVCA